MQEPEQKDDGTATLTGDCENNATDLESPAQHAGPPQSKNEPADKLQMILEYVAERLPIEQRSGPEDKTSTLNQSCYLRRPGALDVRRTRNREVAVAPE